MKTDYEKQAGAFLQQTGSTFKAEYIRYGLYFPSDTEKRDIYKITLSKGERSYTFEFGQSIVHSGYCFIIYSESKQYKRGQKLTKEELKKARGQLIGSGRFWETNKDFQAPSAYDILACITKYDPGTFEDFCGDFGYDTDSRMAEKTYNAAEEEYKQICMLYNEEELMIMAEIQ